MTPWEVDFITFSVDGIAALYASALAAGSVIGLLMVVLTLVYKRA